MSEERYFRERARIEQGHVKYRDKLREEGKLFVRDRLKLLLDPATEFQEDFLFARSQEPDTPAELMRNFENEVLVKALTEAGPVTELHIEMDKNLKTPSGYQWSSPKGPSVTISGGTLCTAEIVTRWQAPITLVLPFLRRAFGLT